MPRGPAVSATARCSCSTSKGLCACAPARWGPTRSDPARSRPCGFSHIFQWAVRAAAGRRFDPRARAQFLELIPRRSSWPKSLTPRFREKSALCCVVGGQTQILDQVIELTPLVALVEQAQQIGGMNGNDRAARRQLDQSAAIGVYGERLMRHGACRGGSERHDDVRLHDGKLVVEPPSAGLDLARVRLFVDAPLAARLVLEALHRRSDINRSPPYAGGFRPMVEHLAGRSHERPARKILFVASLLADQHQRRIRWPFAKHGLARILVQWTARAARRLFGELLQRALGIIDALRLREQRELRITQVLNHRSHLGGGSPW